MQRRTLLHLGIASAVAFALAGGAIALVRPGLKDGRLTEAGRDVFSGVSRALLAGTLPAELGPQQIAVNGLLDRIDALTLALSPHVQAELSQLLGLLATAAGRVGLAGLGRTWQEASVEEVHRALQEMRLSSLAVRQQAYGALHDIVGAAYFADPVAWGALGYPGPTVI